MLLALYATDDPETLYVVKYGSPIVLGIGENEKLYGIWNYSTNDHTRDIIILEDSEIAYLKKIL